MAKEGEDPFPQVAREVQATHTYLAGPSGDMLSDQQFSHRVSLLEQDISDLNATIQIVREDPSRFGMTSEELSARASFISEMRGAVTTLRKKRALRSGRRLNEVMAPHQGKNDGFRGVPNENFADGEQTTQTQLLQRQDEDLDALASAVKRIGNLGRDMHVELEQQGELLEDLGGRFDGTIGRLKAIRNRVDVVMEQTGRRQFCTIVWLSVTFLVLTLLVVLT